MFAAWEAFGEAARSGRRADRLRGPRGLARGDDHPRDGGRRHVTDGPFIETKEQLGGFVFLEVRDLDEAMEWAGAHAVERRRPLTEIRPVMDYDAYAARAASAGERAAS